MQRNLKRRIQMRKGLIALSILSLVFVFPIREALAKKYFFGNKKEETGQPEQQTEGAKSYWLTGAGIGSGVVGVGLGLTAWQVCESFKSPPGGDIADVSRCNSIAIPIGVVVGAGAGFGI